MLKFANNHDWCWRALPCETIQNCAPLHKLLTVRFWNERWWSLLPISFEAHVIRMLSLKTCKHEGSQSARILMYYLSEKNFSMQQVEYLVKQEFKLLNNQDKLRVYPKSTFRCLWWVCIKKIFCCGRKGAVIISCSQGFFIFNTN